MGSDKHIHEPPYVVALDVGSSSVRALLFGRRGRMVEDLQTEIEHRVKTTSDGGAELDPDVVVKEIITCVNALVSRKKCKHLRKHVVAVSCSMFMHTLVGVGRDGRANTPLYMWSDTRSRAALA